MKFTVASTRLADLQLADIWLRASDPQVVADASDRIDLYSATVLIAWAKSARTAGGRSSWCL